MLYIYKLSHNYWIFWITFSNYYFSFYFNMESMGLSSSPLIISSFMSSLLMSSSKALFIYLYIFLFLEFSFYSFLQFYLSAYITHDFLHVVYSFIETLNILSMVILNSLIVPILVSYLILVLIWLHLFRWFCSFFFFHFSLNKACNFSVEQ